MRDIFPASFPRTDAQKNALWERGIFVLDASTLLNIYSYSQRTLDDYMKVIASLGNRILVPYQAASEFFDNRVRVISSQQNGVTFIRETISKLKSDIKGNKVPDNHPQIDKRRIIEIINTAASEIEKYIADATKSIKLPSTPEDDERLARIADLLNGRVLARPSQEQFAQDIAWAKARFELMIPPGFRDSHKTANRPFGDALIWKEMLAVAKKKKAPIIFVTDDAKDDWWQKMSRGRPTPLPYLANEIINAGAEDFEMYLTSEFMTHGARYLKLGDISASVAEAKNISIKNQRADENTLERERTIESVKNLIAENEAGLASLRFAYEEAGPTRHGIQHHYALQIDGYQRALTRLNARLRELGASDT